MKVSAPSKAAEPASQQLPAAIVREKEIRRSTGIGPSFLVLENLLLGRFEPPRAVASSV